MKIRAFLLLESLMALMLALLAATSLMLIVGEGQKVERQAELAADRAFAWHVLRETGASDFMVHDHKYRLQGEKGVFDETSQQAYQVKD
ncbi:hypothetical protein [Lactobacillus corticis]|uniref:Competence protein ComGF n=1 Tax=Lactobacillus corticis TaxID=2201249 RepID=A0A916QHM5_9LACO|nr:hypothetical protein [Lactobacillus corticis]GFZ27129.1 competence protein ComGF [Lactobacillus corticis]